MRLRHSWPFDVILILVYLHLTRITGKTTDSSRTTQTRIYEHSSEEEKDDSYYIVKDLTVESVEKRNRYVRFKWTAPTYYSEHFDRYGYQCTYNKWVLDDESGFMWAYELPGKIAPGQIQSFDIYLSMDREIQLYCAIQIKYDIKVSPYYISNRSNIATVTLPPLDTYTGSAASVVLTVVLPIVFIATFVIAISVVCVCRRRSRARLQQGQAVLVTPVQVQSFPQHNPVHWIQQGQQHPNPPSFPPPYPHHESVNKSELAQNFIETGSSQQSNFRPPPAY